MADWHLIAIVGASWDGTKKLTFLNKSVSKAKAIAL